MTKTELAQELKKEFARGNVKPSQLKKSRSTGDLKTQKPLNQEPFQIEPLETKISVLELQLETSQRELTELNSLRENNSFLTQENEHLKEQMKVKQKELESLRGKLESIQAELKSLKTEQSNLLDENLTLKHQGLKDWFAQYEKTGKVEQELKENMEYASSKLVRQDQEISSLQGQVVRLRQANQSLQKDLNLTAKLVELRKTPFTDDFNSSLTYFKYALYALLAVWFCLTLKRKTPQERNCYV